MKQFEKNLLQIQSSFFDEMEPLTSDKLQIPLEELIFLEAKGLIELSTYMLNVYQIDLTSSGITYFDDKKEARKKILLSWSFDFSMAVLSAVCGSALTLLIQYALMK